MKNGKKSGAPESFAAGSVGFVQKRSIPNVIIGMLCRFAVSFAGAAGVCLMFDNAFMFADGAYDPGRVVLICLAFCAAWFLLCTASYLNGVFFGVTASAYSAAFIYAVSRFGWRESFLDVPLCMWNYILRRLDSLGFTALSGLKAPSPEFDPSTQQGALFVKIGFFAFCGVVSFIFISCLYKKVRAVPVIISAGIVMTLTFTYNILTDNLGFALTAASSFGILVLLYHASFIKDRTETGKKTAGKKEGVFRRRRKALERASAPGLAAFTAAALVFGVAAYPMSRIADPAPRMTVLYDVIDDMRQYFSEYLTGERSGDEDYEADKKSTEPTPREFRNKKLLTVTAQYPSALYLRAWVSNSYSNNKWTAETPPKSGVNILPEEITELFYTIVDVDANIRTFTDRADTDCVDRGFIKEFVTVKSSALSGNTGLTASRYCTLDDITDTRGMKIYEKGYSFKYGVGTVSLSMKKAEYGMTAFSPYYKNVDLSKLDDDRQIYDIVLPYIEEYIYRQSSGQMTKAGLNDWLRSAKAEIEEKAAARSLTVPDGCLINRISDMSGEKLTELSKKLHEAKKYESYVYENCVSVPWSEESVFAAAAVSAFGRKVGSAPSEVFRAASSTARYLASTCSYDLDPKGYTNRGSYAAQFITTAKSGYCVQYATAGALMLRTAGIPTRYVDGYLAPEFSGASGQYEGKVLDSNAHAWIEAYVRGCGWMTFEMTEPMLDGIYAAPGSSGSDTGVTETVTEKTDTTAIDDTTDVSVTTAQTEPVSETEPGQDTTRTGEPVHPFPVKGVITAAIIVLCVLIISTAVYIFLKKTESRRKKRQALLQRAARGESPDPDKDIADTAAYIFFLLERIKLVRGNTELLYNFAKRVDNAVSKEKSFVPAAHAIQKNSFGRCADSEDCRDAAEYALYLQTAVKDALPTAKKIWYCKVWKLI